MSGNEPDADTAIDLPLRSSTLSMPDLTMMPCGITTQWQPMIFTSAPRTSAAIAPDLPLPMDKLAWMQQQMLELGQIPKTGDLAKMVDPDIRVQALERAGK